MLHLVPHSRFSTISRTTCKIIFLGQSCACYAVALILSSPSGSPLSRFEVFEGSRQQQHSRVINTSTGIFCRQKKGFRTAVTPTQIQRRRRIVDTDPFRSPYREDTTIQGRFLTTIASMNEEEKEASLIIPPTAEDEDDDETYRYLLSELRRHDVPFRHLGPHPPSTTSEDSADTRRRLGWEDTTLASGAKAMLIKNGRKKKSGGGGGEEEEEKDDRSYVLAVMAANEKLDWKKMKKMLGPKSRSKSARMATVEEVWEITGCKPGAVPPFGSFFCKSGKGEVTEGTRQGVHTFVDRSLERQGEFINFNCGLRTRSIRMSFGDYVDMEKPELCDFIVDE